MTIKVGMPATISYGSPGSVHTFSGAAKSRIRARFVKDPSGRTVMYTLFRLEVKDLVENSGTTTETLMQTINRTLSKDGQQLRYQATGFGGDGGLTVNVDNVRDVAWGPRVIDCDMVSIGGNLAWEITWNVEFAVPQCSGARFQNAIMAFVYELNYAIDQRGYTTRTYSGQLMIPNNRISGGRATADTADAYREECDIPLPEGFIRTRRDFKLSMDRSSINFTIVDEEKPIGALPAGCVKASGQHTVNSLEGFTISYATRLSASYTISPRKPKLVALQAFQALVQDRFANRQAGGGQLQPAGQNVVNNFFNNILGIFATPGAQQIQNAIVQPFGQIVYLSAFRSTEGLYEDGDTVSFEVEGIIPHSSIQDILVHASMWRPVPNTDWRLWRTSVADVLGVRGSAGLKHRREDDAIIDLCLGDEQPFFVGTLTPPVIGVQVNTQNRALGMRIDPARTWLDYESVLTMEEVTGIVTHKALPKERVNELWSVPNEVVNALLPPQVSGTLGGSILPFAATTGAAQQINQIQGQIGGNIVSGDQNRTKDVKVQRRITPTYRAILTGKAVRIGLKPPIPELRAVGGAPVELEWCRPSLQVLMNIDNLPVYGVRYYKSYRVLGNPTQQPIPAPIDLAKEVAG